ncbi:hypothetical protein OROGR_015118 [Orobanche gracilis]
MDDGTNGNSNSPAAAPFLLKTYEMVDDTLTSSIVSWSPSGLSLVVWNPPEFARDLLPKYFKHNNFSSFIRQLNTYGFRKIDPDQWEFANDEFIRGQRHLLKNIHRRKPIHSHSSQPNATPPLTDSERVEYVKMIENLKQEKHSLRSELDRHQYDNREYENQLRSLGQTLHNIDQRQQQLVVASLARLLQKPGLHAFSNSLPELSENKKRRYSQDEEGSLGGQSLSINLSHPLINMVEKLDSSIALWDKLIDQIPANHHDHHHRDLNDEVDDDCCCSPDQVGSGASDSPPISSICIDLESNDKPSREVDADTGTPTINVDCCGAIASVPQADGANDVFWQQFLTEAPDATVARQVQSDTRRDFHDDDDDRKKDDDGATIYQQNKPWWINVDHKVVQQQMGPS